MYTPTLYAYFARRFLFNTLFFVIGLSAIIYMFDTVELLRRADKAGDVSTGIVMAMGFFKLPQVTQILLPFAVFYSAILTFWQLTRRSELTVTRASGFSVWQFSFPLILTAFLIGIFQITAINPAGALFVKRYEKMERKYLKKQDSEISFYKDGLWLKQHSSTVTAREYVILHAQQVNQSAWTIENASLLYFDQDNRLIRRIDADTGSLQPGQWVLNNARSTLRNDTVSDANNRSYILPTDLTPQDLNDRFLSVDSLSLWQLPKQIALMEKTGLNALKLRVYFQSLLSHPLFYAALVLLAATVSMRPPRLRGGGTLIIIGTLGGFLVFFFINFLNALGISGQIPVILATWTPAFLTLLLGISILLMLEDG